MIVDGFVQRYSHAGKPIGKKVPARDDPAKVAGQPTKKAWMKRARESTFNRPLVYPKAGVA